jgi:hypothetical protein
MVLAASVNAELYPLWDGGQKEDGRGTLRS